jgi:hypothetical protein
MTRAPLYSDPRALALGLALVMGSLMLVQATAALFLESWRPIPYGLGIGLTILSCLSYALLVYTRLPATRHGRRFFRENPAIREA